MRRTAKNVLLFLVCVALCCLLGYLLTDYQKEQVREEARLEKLASEKKQQDQTSEKEKKKEEPAGTDAVKEETKEPEQPQKALGIACWGDELLSQQAAAASSYTVVLQRLLTEQGYQIPVSNKTLTETCSLTVMKMAGVPMIDIDAYIAKHAAAANGAQLPITEGQTRSLTAEQMARADQAYLPVLFLGYYGGWNYDVNELIEQEQKILETFENKEHFLIIGLPPADGRVSADQYHAAMSQQWGEHYLNASEVCPNGVLSVQGQGELAQAVLEKLKGLGYLPAAA